MTKVRINWVDFGKGFAIFLVLVGHVFIGLSESNKFSIANDVLLFLIAQIYIFHIPVFFALSGYFFRPVSDLKEFWYYAKKEDNYFRHTIYFLFNYSLLSSKACWCFCESTHYDT
ncbi:TPA: acyltransferase family protein [Streptococcus pneumoniae]